MTTPLQELSAIKRADVYKGGQLAAGLTRTNQGIEFRYHPAYLDSGHLPVATTLPLIAEARFTPAGAVPPFFAGLLPEGRRLSALRRAIKTSADDELSLLLAVGEDVVGDVQIVPEGIPIASVAAAADMSDPSSVIFADIFRKSISDKPDRVGIPGVQDKVSARMITIPIAHETEHYILKLNPPEFPWLVENEAFFLKAARQCGIFTVHGEIIHDTTNAAGLLIRRFDRIINETGEHIRLAAEDGCQVLDRYPADKYSITSEDMCLALSRLAIAREVAARDLLRQLAFAYLSGNGDAHAKNFAMLQQPNGEWRVTPAFDLPSSYPYGDTTMALSISGRRRENITQASFREFGKTIGITEKATSRILIELCERADEWIQQLDELPFDAQRINKLRRAIRYRQRQLRGAPSTLSGFSTSPSEK